VYVRHIEIKAGLSTIHWIGLLNTGLTSFSRLSPTPCYSKPTSYKVVPASTYRLSFFRLFGLFAVFWGIGGGCPPLGKGLLALVATGSSFLFLISGVRSARSFRRVSNLDASMAPTDLPDFPPAAPIPSNPSTNVSGSNYN